MNRTTFSQLSDLVLYFVRNITIICVICVVIAVVLAYWTHCTCSSILPDVVSNLGILGIFLIVIGGLTTMSAPSRMLSRADVSRTTVQEMQSMRSGPNPWFGIGLSIFLSGLILGTIAVIYV